MATIVLQAAGAFLGGVFGSAGGMLGGAVGAVAGYWLDQTLIRGSQTIEGQRLSGQRPYSAEEGAALPRVYGAARIGGTMIWATRFEETKSTTRQGGKAGGAKVTEYSYFANVAFALCEGEIAGVRRVWADGREVDQSEIEMRVYRGSETQSADPLIEAKQGTGNAPAYRGTAYVVFERFPLTSYGNRIPLLQFEVLRPVNPVAKNLRAVALIPGSSEYGLSTTLVTQEIREGETVAANRHMFTAGSDIEASLDELQALCPKLEHVALVVSWFGNDLRCGECKVRPAVVSNAATGYSSAWKVSGVSRADALAVSASGGHAAFGGTPSDRSALEAIAALKARGLKVTLYPFVMMDVPAGNALPNPYGGSGQPIYPWRGRMTATPAPGQPGSADKAAAARTQVAAFLGGAQPVQFTPATDTVQFGGTSGDWGYRRFVLHFARLAAMAGGVDAFLIGSEMRGLTTLRDQNGRFPFVEGLCDLAEDVRSIVGPSTKLSYAADWSEYFGHQPADGSGDVLFHLDELWAHGDIDAVGIDNYMPLSDWRDADCLGGNPDGFVTAYDPAGLRAAIAGGEGFDWYYESAAARRTRSRTPITDGAYGKPWVFRPKDLVSWWSNPHHNRQGGVQQVAPTAWVPRSKPIWFTELGCPAIDKGPNQPNVFSDPKSSENAVPHFSNGGRSDLAQQRFLDAHLTNWDAARAGFVAASNPVSPVYGGRMVDADRIYVWAWDARPFPAYPLRDDVWADGVNWHLGHWLNGRLAGNAVGDVVNAVLADHGLPAADIACVGGSIAGYVVEEPGTARAALEPIVDLFGLAVLEEADGLKFSDAGAANAAPVQLEELVWDGKSAAVETVRESVDDLPAEAVLGFRDPMRDYQAGSVTSTRLGAQSRRKSSSGFSGTMEAGQAKALLDDWMHRLWSERETVSFALPAATPDVEPGAVVRLPDGDDDLLVTEIEEGLARNVKAKRLLRAPPALWGPHLPRMTAKRPFFAGRPLAILLDLPLWPGQTAVQDQMRLAVWQRPWKPQAVFVSPETSGYAQRGTVSRRATVGRLLAALEPGVQGRIDRKNSLDVELFGGELSSASRLRLLNGANAAAVQAANGQWEVLQFEDAEEISADRWLLSGLLRAQLGTDAAMAVGHDLGARFVLLDDAVQAAGLRASEIGLTLNWRIGPAGAAFTDTHYVTLSAAGGQRAKLPLSPAHLRGSFSDGDLALSWIRRSRIDADDWDSPDVPLGEESERYQIDVRTVAGVVRRTVTVTSPAWTYAAAQITADFGVLPATFDIMVRQLGTGGVAGTPTARRFTVD